MLSGYFQPGREPYALAPKSDITLALFISMFGGCRKFLSRPHFALRCTCLLILEPYRAELKNWRVAPVCLFFLFRPASAVITKITDVNFKVVV